VRSYQVFAAMSPGQSEGLFAVLSERVPAVAAQALAAAGAALKARPVFLKRQPPAKRAEAVRRCLARVGANPLAEEILAVYFLECRKELLLEWLDCAGVKHEDGALQEESPAEPEPRLLAAAVAKFRRGEAADDRELLLRAFAAQSAIDWPGLEALLQPAGAR
jgi:hypothetical protein